jgi:hypothetical protein
MFQKSTNYLETFPVVWRKKEQTFHETKNQKKQHEKIKTLKRNTKNQNISFGEIQKIYRNIIKEKYLNLDKEIPNG